MSDSASLRLVCAPGFAGGRLRHWNQALWLLVEARRRGPGCQAELIFDARKLTRADLDLSLLNLHGDPVRLAGPPQGILADAEQRQSFLARALDHLPLDEQRRDLLEHFLPLPQESLLEASVRLFREFTQPLGLVVSAREAGSTSPAPEEHAWTPGPEITWLSARHLLALRRLGLQPRDGLAGEANLRRAATPQDGNPVLDSLGQLESVVASQVQQLQAAVEDQEPRLQGSWLRLRRDARRATTRFRRAAARSLRNRDGIRGSQLHALAQGLRPADGPQQDGLSLAFASSAFGLDPTRGEEALNALAASNTQGPALVSCADFRLLP